MSQAKRLELAIGLFVVSAIVVIAGMILAFGGGTSLFTETYPVKINFNHIGDLRTNAPVKMAGVRIGQVTRVELNPQTGRIETEAAIVSKIKLKRDTKALIQTSGIVGDSFVEFTVGNAKELLNPELHPVNGTGQPSTTELLAQVKEIGVKVTELVDNVNVIIGSDEFRRDVRTTVSNTAKASESAVKLMDDLKRTSENIFKASDDIRLTASTIRTVTVDVKEKVANDANIAAINEVVQNVRKISENAASASGNLDKIVARSERLFADEEPKLRTSVENVAVITGDLRRKLDAIDTQKGILRYFTTDDLNQRINGILDSIAAPIERLGKVVGNMSKVGLMTSYAKGSRLAKLAEREHRSAGRKTTEEILQAEWEQEERLIQAREAAKEEPSSDQ